MNPAELSDYLHQTLKTLEQNELSKDEPILKSNDPAKVRKGLTSGLPDVNQSFEHVLADFEREILPFLNQNASPNYGAYITGSGNKIGAIAEFIKGYYNQNGLKWNNSPIASELEQLTVQWIADFCAVPSHSKGFLTSGGSMSNLMAIHLALAAKFPEREMLGNSALPELKIYCSDQTHSSVDRALVFLGLGRNCLHKVPVDLHFKIDLEKLSKAIEHDQAKGFHPFMIIGNAGTTNTGSIDPLNDLAKIAQTHNMWYHVDGAYGLPAIRLPELTASFAGIEDADSIIINPHKWMYVPFEASCVLLKEIPEAIHFSPDYLFTENPGTRWESSHHTIELSKEFRALKIWFTMKFYGAEQLTSFVQHDITMTRQLASQLGEIPHVIVDPNHPLSILCFRYDDPSKDQSTNEKINIHAVRKIESDGKIFITGTKLRGQTFLRVYFGNPDRTKADVTYMANTIHKTFQSLVS